MRRAKIVCTIGPASSSREAISAMTQSGMDMARLNFSHGYYESHQKAASFVREEALRQNKIVSILQDLQGIKIRLSDIEGGSMMLKAGDDIFLYSGNGISNKKSLFISYPALLKDVREGDAVLFDDGLIKLIVMKKTKRSLLAKVIEGGTLRSKKGVNLPSSKTSLPALTEKDKRDLEFGLEIGVDYVAISFVRTAEDIELVLKWAKRKKVTLPPLIAKIERPDALQNINEIMDIVDGIMVARGDLGVEMPTEKVPIIQKMLITLANKKGKLVITATQMLESMTQHSRPTRAEATDVANAVLDGTDALMLSAETALGRYPVEAVKVMDEIIRYTEDNSVQSIQHPYQIGTTFPEAIANGASKTAHNIGAKAIAVFTHSGFTARLLSKIRPTVPIIAFTPNEKVLRKLPLYWNVMPKLIKQRDAETPDTEFVAEIERLLLKEKFIKKGDSIVLVASSPFLGKPNIIRLYSLQ